jgi:hypothetical protein
LPKEVSFAPPGGSSGTEPILRVETVFLPAIQIQCSYECTYRHDDSRYAEERRELVVYPLGECDAGCVEIHEDVDG